MGTAEESLRRGGRGLDRGLAGVDDDAVRKVRRHDEVVLHDEGLPRYKSTTFKRGKLGKRGTSRELSCAKKRASTFHIEIRVLPSLPQLVCVCVSAPAMLAVFLECMIKRLMTLAPVAEIAHLYISLGRCI